jgi:chloride channel protein, CIC family
MNTPASTDGQKGAHHHHHHSLAVWMRWMVRRIRYHADHPVWLWLTAVLIGTLAGFATLGFRLSILAVQGLFYGNAKEQLASTAAGLHWSHVWLAPVIGGMVVGGLLFLAERTRALSEVRAGSVAEVIEARAVGKGNIGFWPGVYSALITIVSLGSGASAGREGPAVHLGGALASLMSRILNLGARNSRTLLACGVAGAVAASFNAPLAGLLFALEVVLGHYALRVIAPTAVAATAGAVVARSFLGAQPAFILPPVPSASLIDFPAAALLGLICAALAIIFVTLMVKGPYHVEKLAARLGLPLWALPPIGGVLVGMIGIAFPQVLGVGYEATSTALHGGYGLSLLLFLVAAKILATMLTLSFRFGGGIFSPSIYLGAMAGAAFGALAGAVLGEAAAAPAFFAIVGMGALSGAVLGAPISTTLIVFELTQSYEASVAVLLAVSLATVVTQAITRGNVFQKQIELRGYSLREGPQRLILQTVRVRDFMTPISRLNKEISMAGAVLYADDTLGKALGLLKAENLDGTPVKSRYGEQKVIGYISREDALLAYNQRLVEEHEERSG